MEYIAASEGSGGQHGSVDGRHERLCLVFGGPVEFQGALPDPFFKRLPNPSTQLLKVLLDLEANFLRKAGQFGGQQRGYAEWLALVSNAALPVLDIGMESCQGVGIFLRQKLRPLQQPLSMIFEDCDNQARFRRKVMMNTGLPNLDYFSYIGVAESRVAEIGDQGSGRLEDAVCGFSLHAYKTTY